MPKFTQYNAFLYTDGTQTAIECAAILMQETRANPDLLHLISRVRSLESSGKVPTAAVDKDFRIYLSPEYWASADQNKRRAIALHECLHPLFAHFDRQGAHDVKTWNIATDMVINSIIRAYGIPIASDWFLPPDDYTGPIVAEWLIDAAKQAGKGQGQGQGQGQPEPGQGCGMMSPEEGQALADTPDDGSAPAKASATDAQANKETLGKMRGLGSRAEAAFQRLTDAQVKVPMWRKYISKVYANLANSKRGHVNQTYSRVKARAGVLNPTYVGGEPKIAIVIDTSGSMTDEIKQKICKLAVSLGAQYPTVRTLIVSHTDRVEYTGWARAGSMAKVSAAACGYSGGTYAAPAYEQVAAKAGRVDVLIHFTDCEIESQWPTAPAKKLLVVDFGKYGYKTPVPAGATVIPMD